MPKSKTYEEFVEKFKPKKTTDDCITPPEVYEVVKGWACRECGISQDSIVRPFWPGGDYENFNYPDGCVVLDNPPFSILSKICKFYLDRNIPFFLFAPSLTTFSARSEFMRMNHVICGAVIEYENGARVSTSFFTSFGEGTVAQTAPDLFREINAAVDALRRVKTKELPKYEYPDHIVTAALLGKYSRYGVNWKIRKSDCVRVSSLDAQKEIGKAIFGGGLLLSEEQAKKHAYVKRAAAERAAAKRAAAERAAAERAAAHVFELSERERQIVAGLSCSLERDEEF